MVGIAQLVRAPGCGPGGRRFESGYPPQKEKSLQLLQAFFFLFSEHDFKSLKQIKRSMLVLYDILHY